MTITVSQCYIYPLKSGKAIATQELVLSERGPLNDRTWMLVHDDEKKSGRFISQRDRGFEKVALVQTTVCPNDTIIFSMPGMTDLILTTSDLTTDRINVKIHGDECRALDAGQKAATWFSRAFGQPARLVKMPDDFDRVLEDGFSPNNEQVSFADGFPLLVTSTASLKALKERLLGNITIEMERFRPNIVIDGLDAFEEDVIHTIQIGGTILELVKPCSRCKITTIDQQTGLSTSNEPLRTLGKLRKGKAEGLSGVFFGQNAISRTFGSIKVGEKVEILSRKPLHPALQQAVLKPFI